MSGHTPKGVTYRHDSPTYHVWKEEEINYVRELASKGLSVKEIAKQSNEMFNFNKTDHAYARLISNHNIHLLNDGKFKPGGIPLNRFPKGHVPYTKKPVGTIATRHYERHQTEYLWIKIAEPNVWKKYSNYIWEQHYGEVPKGYMIVFKDNNTKNCDISNLACITRQEHGVMNKRRWRENGEYFDVALAATKLILKRGELRNGNSKRKD